MIAMNRSFNCFALIALAVLSFSAISLLSAASAGAAGNLESFDFHVTDAGGAPTEQADAHPEETTTEFTYAVDGKLLPVEQPRNVAVDLPTGFVGSGTAATTCTTSQLATLRGGSVSHPLCPDNSAVGLVELSVPSAFGSTPVNIPVYNLQPPPGAPVDFAFNFLGTIVHFVPHVRSEPDYGVRIVTRDTPQALPYAGVKVTFWGVPADPIHDPVRGPCLGLFGASEGICKSTEPVIRPLLTNPSACSPTLAASASVDYWPVGGAFDTASDANEDSSGEAVGITGCELPEFEPSIEARPTTNVADSPSGLDVHIHIKQNEDPEGLATAQLKNADLTFPPGMTVNPASAAGLGACSPAQIGLVTPVGDPAARFNEAPVSCPDASRIGTVQLDTPVLPNPLKGNMYLASQDQNPFGSLLALYMVVEDPQTGVLIKIPGRATPDPTTGQLTASFDENPQFPFEDLSVNLFPGSRGALKTPMACGDFTTTSTMTPWTAPEGKSEFPADTFGIVSGANNSPCLASEAQAPNKPSFSAGTTDPTAGSYSPFVLKLSREDGTQPIKAIDTTLPKGLLGRLAGTPYCSDAALAAAAGRSGAAEQASPSCPSASAVGTVNVGAGAGSTPLYVPGKAYLAGPYKGAPLSLAIITPAVAGPFDLGTVVVRVALNVDPESAQVHAVSDPIPTILQGIPLDIRSIALSLDKPKFTLNPTSCLPATVTGSALSVFNQGAALSTPFQLGGCNSLGFKPKLAIALKGGTERGQHPALKATLTARGGDANIGKAVVSLPHSEFLAQDHIKTICTRVQFAANSCPKASIYGRARATSPLLDGQLSGPVYLRSSSNKLPDLVADLGGQIPVVLVGRIDSIKGGIRTSFEGVPDAPVSKFVLEMQGAKKGLLENSRDLCLAPSAATVEMDAQNGKIADFKAPLKDKCKGKARKHKGKAKKHHSKQG